MQGKTRGLLIGGAAGAGIIGVCSLTAWFLAGYAFREEHRCGDTNLLTLRPAAVRVFQVSDGKGLLWKITAQHAVMLQQLEYGNIPTGFLQEYPPSQLRARPFIKGERLVTYTATDRRYVRHQGDATGVDAFCGDYYESGPMIGNEPGAPNLKGSDPYVAH
jgi:hypothetical protein